MLSSEAAEKIWELTQNVKPYCCSTLDINQSSILSIFILRRQDISSDLISSKYRTRP